MVKIILIRHGETDWNLVRRIQGGESDTPLNDTGKNQAAALANRLQDEHITAVFSSPLQRALHTAEAIASRHNLEVQILPSLKEIKVGTLEGCLATDIMQRFDEYLCGDGNGKEPHTPPGGESVEDLQKRVWEMITSLTAQHPNGKLVLVTHYFVIMAIVCRLLDLPLTRMARLKLTNGTITSFTVDGSTIRLDLFNENAHNLK